jgi:elongation factor P
MLNYNEIKERKYIVLDGDPYEVLSSHVFRKQQRKPVNQTKLRNLITGSVRAETFHSQDTVEEADLERKTIKFLYKKDNRRENRTEFWFCDIENPSNRFELAESVVGDSYKYIKGNSEVDALLFNDEIIGLKIPIKVELKVVEAPPAVKGNTATGANKQIELETGLTVNAPLFINEGDFVRINTETGEYVERV